MANYNLNFDADEFEKNLIYETLDHNARYNVVTNEWSAFKRYKFRFDNNYGLFVIKGFGTYGYEDDLWEIALLYFPDPESYVCDLCYGIDDFSDVIGHLTDEEVVNYLRVVKSFASEDEDR